MSLPRGAMGWSVTCVSGISCSYSLILVCKIFLQCLGDSVDPDQAILIRVYTVCVLDA